MAKILFDSGYFVVSIRHLHKKPDGSLYYHRRVPQDLIKRIGKSLIRESLKTRDLSVAAKRIAACVRRDDAVWSAMRRNDSLSAPVVTHDALGLLKTWGFEPGKPPEDGRPDFNDMMLDKYGDDWYQARDRHECNALMTPAEREAARLLYETPEQRNSSHSLSDALRIYLETHPNGNQTKFRQGTERALLIAMGALGDLPIKDITRADARTVRDAIPGTTATKRRRLNTLVAVINKAILEFDLKDTTNPFQRIEIHKEAQDTQARASFTTDELRTIAAACKAQDDDLRWLIALQMDTGARLGEIVGLRREDVSLDGPVPFVFIRSYPSLGRTLKTPNSERKVPLLGMALWGAKNALGASPRLNGPASSGRPAFGSGWLFPRYAADNQIRSDTASASANKWLGRVTETSKTTHCFRHTMKDRLRAARAPEDIQKALLGHGSRTVADGYGQGYPLRHLQDALRRAVETQGASG